MESKLILTILGLFLFSTVSVTALTCYTCTGTNTGPCFDPEGENATNIVCESIVNGTYVCSKFVISTKETDDVVINRECTLESAFDARCQLFETAAGSAADVECFSCNEELCNSSNTYAQVSFMFVALSILIAKLL